MNIHSPLIAFRRLIADVPMKQTSVSAVMPGHMKPHWPLVVRDLSRVHGRSGVFAPHPSRRRGWLWFLPPFSGTELALLRRMSTQESSFLLRVQANRDHIRGAANAPVTLLEYGDFECPHCRAASVIVEAVGRRMGEQLRFVYRHFPLVQIHPHAERAAEAAEAAAAQGKFWPMHDLLFARQDALDDDDLLVYAADLDLEISAFAHDVASRRHGPRVWEDVVSGTQSGVHGTPTFFINGKRHTGAYDLTSLLGAVERAAPVHPSAR